MKRLLILLFCLFPLLAHAGEAKDLAEDPVLEQRMVKLADKLRCLVCQNESLASSRAELAQDLRREVREQMQKGMSDDEIIKYLVARYGDFVLYDPPVKKSTWFLWFGPFALLLIGIAALLIQVRKRKALTTEEAELSEEDAQRAAALLEESSKSPQ